MKHILYKELFVFNRYYFNRNHYTDNRKGVPLHFIAFLKKGKCKIVTEDETMEFGKGDIFYIPMNLAYQSYWYGNDEIVFDSFGFKVFPEGQENSYCLQKINCDMNTKLLLDEIDIDKGLSTKMIGLFFCALGNMVSYMKFNMFTNSTVIFKKAEQFISENPHCTARAIAMHCGISETTLYKVFKEVVNKTPTMVRNEILCNNAIHLLVTTNKSVQEISDSLDFSSTSYFRKVLSAYVGLTPREIRKKYKGFTL